GRWGNIGATLQAVRDHKKTDPLADAGMNDISALVDFRALARAVRPFAQVSALVEQGVLLERLGIGARMERLAIGLTGESLASHIAAHKRLTHADEMGSLFKAIAITAKDTALPAGFEYADKNGENNET
ncbi:MAG: SAM-dependent methyltransferase, partial [Proteobacteria bacterium]|nr:SAM-dependent methyltransferase [Pseudomonadota bacterium]